MATFKAFKDQIYKELKKQHNSSNLFVDKEFPTTIKSLAKVEDLNLETVVWKRPKDIIPNPQFVVGTYEKEDLNQGGVGNCWFIAGCGALTLNKRCREQVIPENQSFDESDYAGIFHFRFWLYGEWYDVVIDDQLLCNQDNELIYCYNKKDKNEMWAPLLEKAYAKLHGSYQTLDGGDINEALINMTGGLDETFNLSKLDAKKDKQPNYKETIKRIMYQAFAKNSMLGCSIDPSPSKSKEDSSEPEEELPSGLFAGHAYIVIDTQDITTNDDKKVSLVKIRNPWGSGTEWNGDWSDKSPVWDDVSKEVKKKLTYEEVQDGEFWMSWDDFFSNFHELEICHCGPSSFEAIARQLDSSKPVDQSEVKDQASVNNDIQNTQLKLSKKELKQVAASEYGNRSVITKRFRLPIGTYVIIPSTADDDRTAEFLLRVFTEKKLDQTAHLKNNKSNLTKDERVLQDKKPRKVDYDKIGADDDTSDIIIEIIETPDEIDQATDAEDPDAQSDSNADANNEST
ncbi:unnamed protein product [Rotaria sp. Silwood1]|nr:unnamed protein product [Rotaria sp. Silwood1]CAF1641176.1 unnamed protein product [Rotaria sp. Silwood1]